MKPELCRNIFGEKKHSDVIFHENPPSGCRALPSGRTDMTEVYSRFFTILRTRLKANYPELAVSILHSTDPTCQHSFPYKNERHSVTLSASVNICIQDNLLSARLMELPLLQWI
jgi:hypothetical protein